MDYLAPALSPEQVNALSALSLAFVGDGVYELMVRGWLAGQGSLRSDALHKLAVGHVSAPAQAGAIRRLLPLLTEEEAAVYRRARNTKVHTAAKNASLADYHAATGLEALFGWLYLLGRRERLNVLFTAIVEGDDHAA